MSSDVAVIIRSCGERTVEACEAIAAGQAGAENVTVIQEVPFERALRRCFEIGIERSRKWTITNDADVLLKSEAIDQLVLAAERSPARLFQVQGWILDKFFGGPRLGGPRAYRTSLLYEAISLLPSIGDSLRPETETINRMQERGYSSSELEMVLGLHDYEQYFRDVYRKAMVYSRKNEGAIAYLAGLWRTSAASDPDFQVALQGLCAGLTSLEPVRTDIRSFPRELDAVLGRCGLTEKDQLPCGQPSPERVEAWFSAAEPSEEFYRQMRSMPSLRAENRFARRNGRLRRHSRRLGLLRLIPWGVGWCACRLGKAIQGACERPRH